MSLASPLPSLDALPQTADGIEILLDLAKKGTIDPWNVDITQVTDEYLAYVERLSEEAVLLQETRQATVSNPMVFPTSVIDAKEQAFMRLTGKTLLYLAVLLRMKSDLLAGFDPFEQNYLEDADLEALRELDEHGEWVDVDAMQAQISQRLHQAVKARYGSLNEVLERRSSAKQKRIRQVTLDDLINELKKYEQLEKERTVRQKIERVDRRRTGMRDFAQLSTEDITALAHDEFQEDTVQWVHEVLGVYLDKSDPAAQINLSTLSDLAETDVVSCFLSLLFLEARYEVVMEQPDFYSDEIWIRWYTTDDEQALIQAINA